MTTKEIELTELEFIRTDRIEVDTVEEAAEWDEETDLETPVEHAVVNVTAHVSERAQVVFERLRRAGVKARSYADHDVTLPGPSDRRRDKESARRFDQALAILTAGDLDGAFAAFTEILERVPESTRLWIFVRAIAQAR